VIVGKYPVFQSPALDEVERKMRPSEDFRHGFLGTDSRKLVQIIDEDQRALRELGLSDERIASELERLTQAAREALGGPVTVDGKFVVRMQVARGRIPSPWGGPKLFRKTRVTLEKLSTGESLAWSDLSLHLLREHGFYQGEGSPYRLDPRRVQRILELAPTVESP